MANIFNSVMLPRIGSNVFDLSHDVKMSFKMGQLVPTCVMDVVPGDKFRINVESMLRFAPLIAPVMHRVNVTTHFYFVPNRLLWPEWEKFIVGDSSAEHPYFQPYQNVVPPRVDNLGSYLGYPSDCHQSIFANPFPVAAYQLIYDEYYRDQNLQNEVFTPLVAGYNGLMDQASHGDLLRRAWQHDYFTSCLPFAQKGDPVELPLVQDGAIPVSFSSAANKEQLIRNSADDTVVNTDEQLRHNDSGKLKNVTSNDIVYLDPNGSLEVQFDSEASTINTLRRAFRLQEWLERNARGGTRYIENILAHFGVKSSDKRLQRPEYLGGSRQNMVISEVLSTAQTDPSGSQEFPVGYLGGHGISAGKSGNFQYRAEEHGWIIGIINCQPVTAYYQGIPKSHTRLDHLDYFWPSFANIGEQEVKVQELYASNAESIDDLTATFGYIPRYAEYKYQQSRVAGEMRDELKHWHLAREFANLPALNDAFIQCNPSDRIFAVLDEETIYAHCYNSVRAVRKMPKFAVPTI